MGPISRSKVSLRISGPKLAESEINHLIGETATEFRIRNIVNSDGSTSERRQWLLSAPENIDFEDQIAWIFQKATNDLNAWKSLNAECYVDIFCGLFMNEDNEGFEFSAEILKNASERGVKIGIDIYAPDEKQNN